LAEVPDLREALDKADDTELIELFDAFDVAVNFDKREGKLDLSASVSSDLIPATEANRPPQGRSGDSFIAGAEFEPATIRVMSPALVLARYHRLVTTFSRV